MIAATIFGGIIALSLVVTPPPLALKHVYTVIASLPAAALLCFILAHTGPGLSTQLAGVGASVGGPIEGIFRLARPLSNIGVVTLLDVECMTLFILCCYGVSIVLHHLVDIVRILKVSRRRAAQW
jgi:hypothetical protein